MGFETKIMISLLGALMLFAITKIEVNSEPQVPCYFVFGDSLVDNGNNNNLTTAAKVNYLPYGVDFPQGPTGRFCNGPNFADIIAQLLGFTQYIPPFKNTTGSNILFGVNYGSGGGGILDDTGEQLGERFSMNAQLKNHGSTVSRIISIMKSKVAAQDYLSKCIYTVSMGSNDYINNYLQPDFYPSSKIYTPDQFAARLIIQYAQQLTSLYLYGARKVAVFGAGLLGCTPAEIAVYGANASGCVDMVNNYAQQFDNRLLPLVNYLNFLLRDAKFTYINTAQITSTSTSAGGNSNIPCCNVTNIGLCVPNSVPCPLRNESTYFDAFHPTTFVNSIIGGRCYNAINSSDAQPYDISTLASLN